MSQYQVKRSDGRTEAPFSSNGLRDLARSGSLTKGDRIRRIGHQTWHDVMKVPDLAKLITQNIEMQAQEAVHAPVEEQEPEPIPAPEAEPAADPAPVTDVEQEVEQTARETTPERMPTEQPREEVAAPKIDATPVTDHEEPPDQEVGSEEEDLADTQRNEAIMDAEDPDIEVATPVAETEVQTNMLRDEGEDDETFEAFIEEDDQWQIEEPAPIEVDDVGQDPPKDMTKTEGPTVLETINNPFKELRDMSTPLSGRTQNALYLILGGLMARPLMTAISSLMNDDSGVRGFLEQIGNLGAIGCTGLGVIMLLSDCLTSRGDETGSEAAMSMLLRVAMVFVIVIMLVVLMQLVGQVKLPDPAGGGGPAGMMG